LVRLLTILKSVAKMFVLIFINWLVLLFFIILTKHALTYILNLDTGAYVKITLSLVVTLVFITMWLGIWRYSVKLYKFRVISKYGAEKEGTD